MSNATDKTSCVSHRPNNRFFVMYEDFLDVAKVSEHQYKLAAFWRILETMTNERIAYNEKLIEDARAQNLPAPRTSLWIEIPYSTFVKRSLGVYKSSSFQVAAAESERLGFSKGRVLKRPRNPLDTSSSMDEYKEYLFLTDVMQSVLNGGEYPPPIEINSPLLKSIAIRKETQKARRAIENNSTPIDFNRGRAIEINTTAIEINRKIESIVLPTKDEEDRDTYDDVADANHRTPSSLEDTFNSWEDEADPGELPTPPRTEIGNAPIHGGDNPPVEPSIPPSEASVPSSSIQQASLSTASSQLSTSAVENTPVVGGGNVALSAESETHEYPSDAAHALDGEQSHHLLPAHQMDTAGTNERKTSHRASTRLPGGNVRADVSSNALGGDSDSVPTEIPLSESKPPVASHSGREMAYPHANLPAHSPANAMTNAHEQMNQPDTNSYSQPPAQSATQAQPAMQETELPALTQPKQASAKTSGKRKQASEQPTLFEGELPAQQGKGRGKQAKREMPAKAEKPKESEMSEEEQAKERERLEKHRQVYANLVKRRGGELDSRQIGRERGAINTLLAAGRTPERIDEHHRYHAEDDWHFNKPGEKAWITAWVIEQNWVTVEIAISDPEYQLMKQAQQQNTGKWTTAQSKVASRVISSFDDPNYTMEDEFYKTEAERRKHYAAS